MTLSARNAPVLFLCVTLVAGCKNSPQEKSPMDLGAGEDLAEADLRPNPDSEHGDLPSANQLVITAPANVVTYTCASLSVAGQGSGGAIVVSQDTTVTLSGLDSGKAFTSLAACRANTGAVTAVTISAGQSASTFYFHTDSAQTFVIGAAAAGFLPGSLSLNVGHFQVLGQNDVSTISQLSNGVPQPYGVAIVGARLFVSDTNNNRVLVWNTLPTTGGQPPDYALGQPAGSANLMSNSANSGGVSGASMHSPFGIATDGTRLYVVDQLNYRVLIWNTIPTAAGQPATLALGQPAGATNLASNARDAGGISGSSMDAPMFVSVVGTRLFVSDSLNSRVLVWNTLPTMGGQPADYALGQPAGATNLTSAVLNNGGVSDSSMFDPAGIASDGTRLFVSDEYNNRVLVWNTIPTTGGQAADFGARAARWRNQPHCQYSR